MPDLTAACTVRVADDVADALVERQLAFVHPRVGLRLTRAGVDWFADALAREAQDGGEARGE